jgi:hypothetical protein
VSNSDIEWFGHLWKVPEGSRMFRNASEESGVFTEG